MRIIYNTIDLGVLETHSFAIEPVYDETGTDYLFSKVTMVVRALINGQAEVITGTAPGPFLSHGFYSEPEKDPTSTRDDTQPRPRDITSAIPKAFLSGTVPPSTGMNLITGITVRRVDRKPNAPPLTHQAIRQRLSSPRGTLYVFSGSSIPSGTSPDEAKSTLFLKVDNTTDRGITVDCKNGPTPKLLDVKAAFGDANTLIVDWSCETYINESPLNGVQTNGALLSNRFSQTHMVDKNGFTTVFVGGMAIYRTDLLYKLLKSPDTDRNILFMPIGEGFVRENIEVVGLPDVTGISYSYRDRQVPIAFPGGVHSRAASISVYHRQALSTGDFLEGALSAYERYLGIKANKHFANAGDKPEKPAVADWHKGKI